MQWFFGSNTKQRKAQLQEAAQDYETQLLIMSLNHVITQMQVNGFSDNMVKTDIERLLNTSLNHNIVLPCGLGQVTIEDGYKTLTLF